MAAYMTASQLSQQYQSVLKPANKPEHEISQVTSTEDKYEVRPVSYIVVNYFCIIDLFLIHDNCFLVVGKALYQPVRA